MKILLSTSLFFPAQLGGPANTLYWMAKGLTKVGMDVSVVTTNSNINEEWVKSNKWLLVDKIRVRYCSSGIFATLRMLWHNLKEMPRCDVVVLCDMFQKQILFTAIMAYIYKKHIIWSPRGELFSSVIDKSCLKQWYIGLVRYFFGQYVTFHATSLEEEKAVRMLMGKKAKIVVVPNYIELPALLQQQEAKPPYLLYLGRIAPIKALEQLIDGLVKSEQFKSSDFIFVIAGGVEKQFQEYYQKLVNKVKGYGLQNKIFFIGSVHGDKKFQTYANAYAMFLMSHSENFGNVVVEALSQGTPVIASKGTPWEVLDYYRAGFWINNSPSDIANTVDCLLKMKANEYGQMRKNARVLGETYDIYKNIGHWKLVFTSLCPSVV